MGSHLRAIARAILLSRHPRGQTPPCILSARLTRHLPGDSPGRWTHSAHRYRTPRTPSAEWLSLCASRGACQGQSPPSTREAAATVSPASRSHRLRLLLTPPGTPTVPAPPTNSTWLAAQGSHLGESGPHVWPVGTHSGPWSSQARSQLATGGSVPLPRDTGKLHAPSPAPDSMSRVPCPQPRQTVSR